MIEPATIPFQLRQAADYIETHGWCQGKFERDDGHVCVSRAIHRAGGDLAARLAFVDFLGTPDVSLLGWNDTPGRTAEEVIAALRECARQLAAGERWWP